MTADELREQVASGAIDTVLLAFCDMQGRLMGKRMDAGHSSATSSSTARRAATTCSPSTSR
jgi:glutamine synthetase